MQYYEALGLAPNAEPQVIAAAYRALMKKWHPDSFMGGSEEAERRSKELNAAYAVLKDPARRAEYDSMMQCPSWRSVVEGAPPGTTSETSSYSPAQSDPWDWENDHLGLRGREEVKPSYLGWKLGGGLFALLMAVSIIQDFNR